MTTHKLTGPPLAELVVPVDTGDVQRVEWVSPSDDVPGEWHVWRDGDPVLIIVCPFRPGDGAEFWPACADCDTQASCVGDATVVQSGEVRTINDVPLCPEHCAVFGRKVCDDIIPEFRTVTRVEARERDGWEWVVFLA